MEREVDKFTSDYESVLGMLDNVDTLDVVSLLANYCAVQAATGGAHSGLHALAQVVYKANSLMDPEQQPSVTEIMGDLPRYINSLY